MGRPSVSGQPSRDSSHVAAPPERSVTSMPSVLSFAEVAERQTVACL